MTLVSRDACGGENYTFSYTFDDLGPPPAAAPLITEVKLVHDGTGTFTVEIHRFSDDALIWGPQSVTKAQSPIVRDISNRNLHMVWHSTTKDGQTRSGWDLPASVVCSYSA